MTPFSEAKPGDESYTYDARPVTDEFGWVTDLEFFTEDLLDPIDLKRQRWRLVSEDTIRIHPRAMLCTTCFGDEVVPEGDGDEGGGVHEVACPRCDGSGTDPDEGKVVVL